MRRGQVDGHVGVEVRGRVLHLVEELLTHGVERDPTTRPGRLGDDERAVGPADERERLFGVMLPRGTRTLPLSQLNLGGLGPRLVRYIMAEQRVASLEELIDLAKEMRAAQKRGDTLKLTDDELAFYDALEVSDSAVQVLGDATLRTIARELVEIVRNNVSIDWTVKESIRAKLRVIVKRILRKHGYPPDKQETATNTVLQQAELLSDFWLQAGA